MKIAGIKVRRRFFVSVGLVIAVTIASLYWSRSNHFALDPAPASQPVSFVRIAVAGQGGHERLLEERAEYFDPTPLFLPTNRNYQQGALPSRVVKQPGQVFQDFEPKFNFTEYSLPDYGAVNDPAGSNSLPELLSRGNDAPFAGFGRVDQTKKSLAIRVGFIEVKGLKNGALSLAEALTDLDLPEIDYAPADFVVAVASAGLIGDPVLTATSGKEEIDGKLKDYLVRIYRIGERLAPGSYLVSVGP